MDINASSIETKPLLAEVENDIQVENPLPRTNNNESAFRIWKNFMCLCFVFALVFTSYLSLQNIESTLNSVAGLGITSLACVYLAVFISGIFAPVVVDYTSCKWVIVLGVFAQVVFVSSNFYPSWYTLVPASLFLGIISSFFWTGQGIYLTNMAIDYSNIKNADLNQILTRFNGIFFFFFQSSQIFGNLISSLVLHAENGKVHNTSMPITNSSDLICGFHHCNKDEISVNSTNGDDHTSKDLVYILIGIYLALDVIALALTVIFLDNRPVRTERKKFKDSLSATLRFHKHKWILPLLPFFLYNGMEQGFLFSEYTSSFPGCAMGLSSIGYIMICFGVTDALFSLLVDRISKIIGRCLLVTFAFVIHAAMLMTMIFWDPITGSRVLFYAIPALWGVADAVYQAITCSILGIEFHKDLEPVFAIYRMWQALGFASLAFISHYLCMDIKIYIVGSLLTISMVLYFGVEFDIMRCKRKIIQDEKQSK